MFSRFAGLLLLAHLVATSSLLVRASSCTNRTKDVAVHKIPGAKAVVKDIPSADICEEICCSNTNCTAWSFTHVARPGQCEQGCCFLHSQLPNEVMQYTRPDVGFTTGCKAFSCSPTPDPNPHPLSFPYVRPSYSIGRVFASIENITLRDCTTALFDPITSSWHIFSTNIDTAAHGHGGYWGTIWHWTLNNTDLFANEPWVNAGMTLNASYVPGAFDATGVFTPAAVRQCTNTTNTQGAIEYDCEWVLFYGGVNNLDGGDNTAERIGVATSKSPWGPFERWERNPVFTANDTNSNWCGGTAARVDDVTPTLTNDGKKVVLVKSVCSNFTALPVVYIPQNQSSWGPPYDNSPGTAPTPLFNATAFCGGKGFEKHAIYLAPDGHLHFQGHNHGKCPTGDYSHFVSVTHDLRYGWQQAQVFRGQPAVEPVPIPTKGDGVMGGEIMLNQWIDFPNFKLTFMNVTWIWSNGTDSSAADHP